MSMIQAPPSTDPESTARPEVSVAARAAPAGTAPIKPEYLIAPLPVVALANTADLNGLDQDDLAEGASGGRGDARDNKRHKASKKEKKGQNKARHFPIVREASVRLCKDWETKGVCERQVCKYAHSWDGYFEVKPSDVSYDPTAELVGDAPYVVVADGKGREVGGEDPVGKTIDLCTTCPVLRDLGYCTYGWRCRYLGGHARRVTEDETVATGAVAGPSTRLNGWELLGYTTGEAQAEANGGWKFGEINWVDYDTLGQLKRNEVGPGDKAQADGQYDFPFARAYLSFVEPDKEFTLGTGSSKSRNTYKRKADPEDEEGAFNAEPVVAAPSEEDAMNAVASSQPTEAKGVVVGESEAMDVPLRPEEKKRLNWEGGRYLAPLTTVGNLPLVTGHNDEWALCRRHESEKMFGIQLAGGFANRMVPAAELIKKTIGSGVDFVDINMVVMDAPGRLAKMLVGMNRALGDTPLTVKFRTGVANGKPNAHKLIPKFATQWGAGALTIHGRSRQQRYSKLADWEYIKTCATTLRESLADANLPPVPIFGNGDCFSAQSYYDEMDKSGVDGVMVARGALIKPWIFTEIKERREWDISATERLEGIRKVSLGRLSLADPQFAEYGLSHWGSDTQGINTTRRFLCEALSFQHRYVPIGLLERLPPMLNERPPAYRGRNELETLLSSPFAGDWVKISEMFLGKIDEGFNFIPKHKSNAYGAEEAQG
ncbi:hypothetical protein IAU60_001939 [Kwoniella sp. DSM 27419]